MSEIRLTSLKGNQILKDKLRTIATRLNDTADDEKSHLADIGCYTRELSRQLTELTKEIFEIHKVQSGQAISKATGDKG